MVLTIRYLRGYDEPETLDIIRIVPDEYQGLSWLSLYDKEGNEYIASEIFMDAEGVLTASCPENF